MVERRKEKKKKRRDLSTIEVAALKNKMGTPPDLRLEILKRLEALNESRREHIRSI